MPDLRYPIGPMVFPQSVTPAERTAHLATLRETPQRLREAVAGLPDARLDTPYRPGGWTVRQVVHHVADANLNAYIRMKLAITDKAPTINQSELREKKPNSPFGTSVRCRSARKKAAATA